MIGVIARPAQHAAVREFFELFKTPWELYREGTRYPVILDADGTSIHDGADLIIVYGSQPNTYDRRWKCLPAPARDNRTLSWSGLDVPVYGSAACFPCSQPRWWLRPAISTPACGTPSEWR